MDMVSQLGALALGSRLKRASDLIMQEGKKFYETQDIDFEPRWFPLTRLLVQRKSANICEAARDLGVSHVLVSKMAREMTKKGLLSTRRCHQDQRKSILELTPKGKKLVAKLEPVWNDIHATIHKLLSENCPQLLLDIEKMERALDKQSFLERCQSQVAQRKSELVSIVDYKPQLRNDFERLNAEWLTKYFKVEEIDQKYFNDPTKYILQPGGDIFFAVVDEGVVGTCAIQHHGEGHYEVMKMGVQENFRGKKIGERLLLEALSRARGRKARRIFLRTNSALTPAVTLYRKHGFKEVAQDGCDGTYERCNLTMELPGELPEELGVSA